MTLRSADGAWTVQQISVDGRPTLLVERHVNGRKYLPAGYGSGYCATPAEVERVIGTDAFASLQPA